MTAPPWGLKPEPVSDPYQYWLKQPPAQSVRCTYWLARYQASTWRPNKWLRRECSECRAKMLGIYIWEATHVLGPLIAEDYAKLSAC